MPRVPLLVALLVLCLLAACGSRTPEPEPTATPTSTPTPEPTPEPEPTPTPTAGPVTLALESLDFEVLDNAGLRGEAPREPDEGALHSAADGARTALERYLNAQFVAPETRFTDAAIAELLGPSATASLSDEARQGLGQLPLDVSVSAAGPATARAIVIIDGPDVLSVTMSHDLAVTLVHPDGGTEEAHQHGTMIFRPIDGQWRAEVLEIALDAPEVTP
jgi:hypothetical protein